MTFSGIVKDGAIGACFSAIQLITLGHPCERVKTELQINQLALRATLRILYTGGVSEFYKGLRWNLIYQSGKSSIRWMSVPRVNRFYQLYLPEKIKQNYPVVKTALVATTQAIFETLLFSCPLDVLKIRNMTRPSTQKIHLCDLVKSEGLLVLWRGGLVHFLKQEASWISYLVGAQQISRLFDESRTVAQDLAVNSLAGGVNVLMKAPFDAVKTRLQKSGVQKVRADIVLAMIIRENGLKGLWRGSGVAMVHSVWFSATMLTAMKYFNVYDVTK